MLTESACNICPGSFFTARNVKECCMCSWNTAPPVSHGRLWSLLDLVTALVIKRRFQDDTTDPRFVCQLMLAWVSAVALFPLFPCIKKNWKMQITGGNCEGLLDCKRYEVWGRDTVVLRFLIMLLRILQLFMNLFSVVR